MATKPQINTSYAQTRYNLTRVANRKNAIRYIVDHYTGTDACAKNNCIFFGNGDRQASADFFIDKNGAIYQFNANLNLYYSWHCGDGYGKYGITNANSIGIEVVSAGKEFTAAQKESLRKLHLWLMAAYSIPASRVVRHYDASRKLCPKPYCGTATKNRLWTELHAKITAKAATKTAAKSSSYKVKVTADVLNVRNGAGTNYKVNTTVRKNQVYTIVQEKNGWGKLLSGAGWISLSYTKRV